MDEFIDKALWLQAKVTLRLRTAILAPEGVDEATVRSDRQCEFGQWMFGPGLKYCGMREYQHLKGVHRRLHAVAFDAFCACRQGDVARARASVTDGGFAKAMVEMRAALVGLRDAVAAKDAFGGGGQPVSIRGG